MDALFWERMHGGSTHFPIVLLLASVMFDFAGWRSRPEDSRRGLQLAGLASAVVGVLGGVGAVVSGLVMSRGQMLGSGYEKFHHLFVWPAFGLCVICVAWRLLKGARMSQRGFGAYLGGMSVAGALMMGAGYWGGEMLLGAETRDAFASTGPSAAAGQGAEVTRGRQLYLMNCAHCHAEDATGDEGPDLHGVLKSNAQIAGMIKNGAKGKMPKFGAKLTDPDVGALIAYIHSLK